MLPTSRRDARHRDAPSRRRGRRRRRSGNLLAVALGVPLGLIACGGMVWQASYAAFTADTSNAANSWQTGTVVLTDNDNRAALFNVTGLKPSTTTTSRCIEVAYSGSLSSDVRLYSPSPGGDTSLAQTLTLRVERGSRSTSLPFGDCSGVAWQTPVYQGTLAGFQASHGTYANGFGSRTMTAGTRDVFRFTYGLPTSAPNTLQGRSATATFTWEARPT